MLIMRNFLVHLLVLVGLAFPLSAQTDSLGHGITCAMQDTAWGAYQSASPAFLSGAVEIKTRFDLVFSDDVPAVAQAAMTFAASIWGSYLDSEVPVRVDIAWTDREDNRLLASAGPATLFRDFLGGRPNTWYPVALAEAIAGRDLNDPGDADINVNANSTANWYFGTDGRPPRGQIDLVSVMLHELGHGLGFLASVDTINENQLSIGFGNRFIIYDIFMETEEGQQLVDPNLFRNPSVELRQAVQTDELVFNGTRAINENANALVPLFAPRQFNGGSSVSHLDERRYAPGSENALMTPFLSAGEAVHDPGPVTLGIFADMGWPLVTQLTSTVSPGPTPVVVYPNPASERVYVQLPAAEGAFVARLMTADGQLVRTQTLASSNGSQAITTSGLPAGLYYLILTGQTTQSGARVVIR